MKLLIMPASHWVGLHFIDGGDIVEKRLEEMKSIMAEKDRELEGKQLPPLDPEGEELARHKRETFDIIDTPIDPLR